MKNNKTVIYRYYWMRKISIILIFLSSLSEGSIPPYETNLQNVLKHELWQNNKDYSKYRCTVGAHRGASNIFTENTLNALLAADKDSNFAFIEFDVQYTKDKKIVVFHDRNLLRIYRDFNSINNSTYRELTRLTNGNILLYYDVIGKLNKKLNIEIKSQGDHHEDKKLVDELMNDILKRHIKNQIMISSISPEIITYINEEYPSIPTGQIHWLTMSAFINIDVLTDNLFKELYATKADYLMLHVTNLANIENLLELKPKNKTIIFWNFDNKMYLIHKDITDRMW